MNFSVYENRLLQFFYWMNERHAIYLRKEAGEPPPWTDDNILRTYKFTNVFRKLDRVSRYYIYEVYRPNQHKTVQQIVFNTILFRAFNWPPTWELHGGWKANIWDPKGIKRKLKAAKDKKIQVFTGAYIITNAGQSKSKINYVVDSLTEIFLDRNALTSAILAENSLENCVGVLIAYPTLGKFTAYEVACDLTYTHILKDAEDIDTWANTGPGAKRGLNIIFRRKRANEEQMLLEMQWLLEQANNEHWNYKKSWPLHLREIEHSLCEYAKYVRGYSRSRYNGNTDTHLRKS